MENTIMSIISILIQTIICTYFITSFSKFINNTNYSKKQLFLHSLLILLSTIIRNVNKKYYSIP